MFSDYIVYVDESGDHGLVSINQQNPVFVLAFCIFDKEQYRSLAVPAMQKLKFAFWGHDCVIMHSHEIRKRKNDFNVLLNAIVRDEFMAQMNVMMEAMPVTIIAAAINKNLLVRRYQQPDNPYEIALRFCMERLVMWLREAGQAHRKTHIIVERRGKVEDDGLELEFRRIADGQNFMGKMPSLDLRFMDKKHNSTGLQIADLIAYPIARHIIEPAQANRAFELIRPKFRTGPEGRIQGYGLKVFP